MSTVQRAAPGEKLGPVQDSALQGGAARRYWIVFSLVAGAMVSPFWVGRYLPLLDLPNHLALVSIWHNFNDPRFDFAKYYRLRIGLVPYFAHYFLVHLLAFPFGVEIANKIFLTAYSLSIPLGLRSLALRFGRSPWLAFIGFPLVWNDSFRYGFLTCVAGLGLLPFAWTIADWHAERPSALRGLSVCAVGIGLYLFHVIPFALFVGCGGLLMFAQREPLRPRLLVLRLAPLVLSGFLGLVLSFAASRAGYHPLSSHIQFTFDPVLKNLRALPERMIHMLPSGRDQLAVAIVGCAWLVLIVAGWRRWAQWMREWWLVACFTIMFAACLLAPRSLLQPFYWWGIHLRFVVVTAMFAALLVRGPIDGWRRWLLVPIIGANLFLAGDLVRMVVKFNRNVSGYDEIIALTPYHKPIFTLMMQPRGDEEATVECFNHWAAYTQLYRGGYNPWGFDDNNFPKEPKLRLPAPPEKSQESFSWERHAPGWDYFLTHNESARGMFPKLAREGKIRLVAERGPWRLWQRVEH